MKTFVIEYFYDANDPRIQEVRPSHREFLAGLKAAGKLVGSGPFTDVEGASLIIIRLPEDATVTDAETTMAQDPFLVQELIEEVRIRTWNPVLNVFKEN